MRATAIVNARLVNERLELDGGLRFDVGTPHCQRLEFDH